MRRSTHHQGQERDLVVDHHRIKVCTPLLLLFTAEILWWHLHQRFVSTTELLQDGYQLTWRETSHQRLEIQWVTYLDRLLVILKHSKSNHYFTGQHTRSSCLKSPKLGLELIEFILTMTMIETGEETDSCISVKKQTIKGCRAEKVVN